jgi:acylphosphatase
VEVVAGGPPEALASLESRLGGGPALARVKKVEKSDISDDISLSKSFDIR